MTIHDPLAREVVPSGVKTSYERLDAYRLEERCLVDQIATEISLHLYNRQYDQLPAVNRASVERAALRALRSPQAAWQREAMTRAIRTLDRAMAEELGAPYAAQDTLRRLALATRGVDAVLAAFVGTLEIDQPFDGPADALRIYDAAQADAATITK